MKTPSYFSRLASQHHASEYNQVKFGPNGSPLPYVPYSVQMPDHYREMQAHQLHCAGQETWWIHKGGSSNGDTMVRSTFRIQARASLRMSPGTLVSVDLHEELSAAMTSSIIPAPKPDNLHATTPTPQPQWQTSETHPIVISTMIPSEVLPTISSQLRLAAKRYPVVLNVPASQSLDRLISKPANVISTNMQQVCSLVTPPTDITSDTKPVLSPPQSLAKSFGLSSRFWVHPTVRRTFLGVGDEAGFSKRPRSTSFVEPISTAPPVLPIIDVAIPAVPSIPPSASTRLIGNLYMSSCPGKKVRLDGPVKGRNTVCRDLWSDLSRIKSVGVSCIICCLDDNELESLGVSWQDYAQTANDLAIDILRIPIPEGLAPLDAASLDAHLMTVISTYTFRGSAILVHCRGGVGRAGIIACCWMLKLGLCGWLEPPSPSNTAATSNCQLVDEETLHLVKRVLSVVRKRRSPKAVETYEQVKFLVDYIKFLQERASNSSTRTSPRTPTMDLFADWEMSME
ncbi:protein-tyrosine phosphatase-like protein [Fomes fomentarius]|nr:protein-tyrosine phosphatase-like protein [Fomes fomentarius]